MAEEQAPEGWTIGRRAGRIAAVAAAAIPVMLLVGLVGTGLLYERRIAPATHRPPTVFPAPGIETFIHDGALDPQRAPPIAKADPRLAAAKRAVVSEGLAGWPRS